jgi:hypothetical protein
MENLMLILLKIIRRSVGAVTRGIIDTIGRSANGQEGIRKDALDVTNSRNVNVEKITSSMPV